MRRTRLIFAAMTAASLLLVAGCSRAPETASSPDKAGSDKAAAEKAPGAATAIPAPRPPAPPPPVILAEGTKIKVRTTSALSTKTTQTGERFVATLADPIVQNGVVIAERGATVNGRVVESDAGGRVKGRAVISIRLSSLETAGGRSVDLETGVYAREAKSTKGQDAAKIGIGAGVGAAIGAIAGGGKGAAIGSAAGAGAGTGVVMATRGAAAVIPAETLITFSLKAPATVSR